MRVYPGTAEPMSTGTACLRDAVNASAARPAPRVIRRRRCFWSQQPALPDMSPMQLNHMDSMPKPSMLSSAWPPRSRHLPPLLGSRYQRLEREAMETYHHIVEIKTVQGNAKLGFHTVPLRPRRILNQGTSSWPQQRPRFCVVALLHR